MRMIRQLFVVIFAALCSLALTAQPSHPLLQRPTFNGNLIVFSYAGDLWTVDRNGGHASRLTTGTGIETDPVFSPDGSMIAFTGEYDGNTDVFVVPTIGGVPKRLTYHPAADSAVGWTPDGKSVIFRSNRESSSSRYTKLFKVSLDGGLPTALPLPMAFSASFPRTENTLPTLRWAAHRRSIIPPMLRGETTAADWQARYGLPTWRRWTW